MALMRTACISQILYFMFKDYPGYGLRNEVG